MFFPLGQPPSYEKCMTFVQRRSCYCLVWSAPQLWQLWHSTLHNQAHHDKWNMTCPSMKHSKRAAVALSSPRPEEQLSIGVLPNPVLTGTWTPLSPCLGEVLQSCLFPRRWAWRADSPKTGSQVNMLWDCSTPSQNPGVDLSHRCPYGAQDRPTL